jgi:hypothetical protein
MRVFQEPRRLEEALRPVGRAVVEKKDMIGRFGLRETGFQALAKQVLAIIRDNKSDHFSVEIRRFDLVFAVFGVVLLRARNGSPSWRNRRRKISHRQFPV